ARQRTPARERGVPCHRVGRRTRVNRRRISPDCRPCRGLPRFDPGRPGTGGSPSPGHGSGHAGRGAFDSAHARGGRRRQGGARHSGHQRQRGNSLPRIHGGGHDPSCPRALPRSHDGGGQTARDWTLHALSQNARVRPRGAGELSGNGGGIVHRSFRPDLAAVTAFNAIRWHPQGVQATLLGRRPVHRSARRGCQAAEASAGRALAEPGCEGERRLQRRRWGVVTCLIIVLALAAGTLAATANATRDRTLSLYNIHTKETLTIQYMKGGKRLPDAMQKINWILRDWRKDEPTQMDPDLIDLLWEIHAELGSTEPIHIISGFRSRDTNNLLRKTVGGQASESRHILGKAADVHFPDIPIRQLRYSALIHERGGVGYYPTSAIPFVHVDTDRVRAWPRLPRTELALLFPSGRTQHIPDDGEPISKEDVRMARAK